MSTKTRKRAPKTRELTVTVQRPPSSFGLLTLDDVVAELTLSKTTVLRLIALGKLKAVRPIPNGKAVRVFRADLQAFVDGLRA